MGRDREYELTFTIAPEATERLVAHPKIRPALRDRRVDHLVSTYFDTPDATLRRHRFGLRVRRGGSRVVHTLKRTGTSLVDRGEWETADAGSRPDAAWLRRTPAAPLLAAGVADALAPCFTVEVTRTTLPLRYGKTRIEAAIDEGAIASGGLSLPLHELELELKAGRRGRALDLARTLVRDLPLALSLASKAERGYGVSSLTWGRADDAIDPALTKGMTIAQVFEAVVQACLYTVLKNAALILGEADIEPVHKTRIALRHLRAVLALFAPMLRRRRLRALRGDLKWLSRRLGEARDADVFRHRMLAPIEAAQGDIPGADAFIRLMEARRQGVHARLRQALGSARVRLLFLDVLAMSESGVRRSRRGKSARRFVRRALEKRRRGLAHATKRVDRKSVAELHDIRKDVKALRYDIALFAKLPGVAAKTQRRRHAKALKTLQESLGVINDEQAMRAHVAAAFEGGSHDLPDGEMRQAASAAAAVLAGREGRHTPELRRAAKAAKRLKRRLA